MCIRLVLENAVKFVAIGGLMAVSVRVEPHTTWLSAGENPAFYHAGDIGSQIRCILGMFCGKTVPEGSAFVVLTPPGCCVDNTAL